MNPSDLLDKPKNEFVSMIVFYFGIFLGFILGAVLAIVYFKISGGGF